MTQTEDGKAREAMAKLRRSMQRLREGVPMFEAKYAAADAGKIPVCETCRNAHLKGIPNPDGGVFCPECLWLNEEPFEIDTKMKNWQQIAEEMTAMKDTVVAMKAETRRMGEELGICPACHGAGCILEPEESFSYSKFDPCTKCKCSGKVEAKI